MQSTSSSSPHVTALTLVAGGLLTATGLALQHRPAYRDLGVLLMVTAVIGTSVVAGLRCYDGGGVSTGSGGPQVR